LLHKLHALLPKLNEVFDRSESFLCQFFVIKHVFSLLVNKLLPSYPEIFVNLGGINKAEEAVDSLDVINALLLHELLEVFVVEDLH